MAILHEIRKRARRVAAPALGALLAVYFTYHMVQGEYGLIAYLQLKSQGAASKANLAELRAEEAKLARRVTLLRPDSLDPDLLDEQARRMLGFVHPDELVILNDDVR